MGKVEADNPDQVLRLSAGPDGGRRLAALPGLAVGAMGSFVLGLYVRRWLVERKALAGGPRRDMIA